MSQNGLDFRLRVSYFGVCRSGPERFSYQSFCPRVPPLTSANFKKFEGVKATWNKEQLSGSTTLKVLASSLVRPVKTCSCTFRRFTRRASAVCRKARQCSLVSSKDRKDSRQKTFRFS